MLQTSIQDLRWIIRRGLEIKMKEKQKTDYKLAEIFGRLSQKIRKRPMRQSDPSALSAQIGKLDPHF